MEIVLATRNKKKIVEVGRIMDIRDLVLRTMDDYSECPEVEEDAPTFEGNAIKKARAVAEHTGRIALADDSGLEVDAIGGAPGVYSARYAGPTATDSDNVSKLLNALADVPETLRTASFRCVIAIAMPTGEVRTFSGSIEGRIGRERKGTSGFGYDPVFYPEGETRTFAEMSGAEKDTMSHRGRALELAREFLAQVRPPQAK